MIKPNNGFFKPLVAGTSLGFLLFCSACVPPARDSQGSIVQNPPPPQQKAQQKDEDDTLDKAGSIASQPVRDVGVSKKKVPPILEKATQSPYAAPANRKCSTLNDEITQLNAVLGPDYTDADETKKENRAGKLAEAGGKMVVNSLIPFRGLVREISGAGPAERRFETAVAAGLARRGFLRGLAKARRCRLPHSGE